MNELIIMQTDEHGVLHVRISNPALLERRMAPRLPDHLHAADCRQEAGGFVFDPGCDPSLEQFLKEYSFEKNEIFAFINDLFSRVMEAAVNAPVILDTRAIFVSPSGQSFRFCVVPFGLEAWIERSQDLRGLIGQLLEQIQTPDCFEMHGFLYQLSKQEQLQADSLRTIGESAWQKVAPRTLLGKPRALRPFKARHAVSMLPRMDFEQKPPFAGGLQEASGIFSELLDQKTMLMEAPQSLTQAYLQTEAERIALSFETMTIGRHPASDIVLSDPSVSASHARITCQEGRYYLQDLKSANGTHLNEKNVIRRMRLKDGMNVRFGAVEMVFHE